MSRWKHTCATGDWTAANLGYSGGSTPVETGTTWPHRLFGLWLKLSKSYYAVNRWLVRDITIGPNSGQSFLSSIDLPMAQRVESLALASMHAKSSTMQDAERAPVDFVTELEETNDVANIQLEIWQAIANEDDVTEEAVNKADLLQKRLIPISEVSSITR